MIKAYLQTKKRSILCIALVVLAVGMELVLSDVPLDTIQYAAVLATVIIEAFVVWDFVRFQKTMKLLESMEKAADQAVDLLPIPENELEERMGDVLRATDQKRRMLETESRQRYDSMVEYYTIWAHQIKTPIAAMRLMLQQQKEEETVTSERTAELSEELQRIEQYVEMVLVFLRLESNSTDYVIRKERVDEILRPCIRKFASTFIRRKIRLEYTVPETDGETEVLTDTKWLQFVVEQVLTNALKYTAAGGTIRIRLEAGKVLCIEDSGVGIPAEDLPRIFEYGYTGTRGREHQKASGLGLYLCKRICKRLGHKIWVTSEVGVGTSVKISLQERALEVE